jgi:hypothetical protein
MTQIPRPSRDINTRCIRSSRQTRPLVSVKRKKQETGRSASCAMGGNGLSEKEVLVVVMLVVRFRSMHEPVRMRLEVVTHTRVVVQVFVKAGMAVHELLIVDQ